MQRLRTVTSLDVSAVEGHHVCLQRFYLKSALDGYLLKRPSGHGLEINAIIKVLTPLFLNAFFLCGSQSVYDQKSWNIQVKMGMLL